MALALPPSQGVLTAGNARQGKVSRFPMDLTSNELPVVPPPILLASDDARSAAHLHRLLREQDFVVEFAPGYGEIEALAEQHRNAIVLLEVSRDQSVEAAIEAALRVKRTGATRFVGYLADRILRNSGLAGDAIFPRHPKQLADALRNYFGV